VRAIPGLKLRQSAMKERCRGVLDAGTALRWTRLGVAMTYATADLEGSFSVEQTVSGSGGLVPVATVFRIVMRTSRWPF